MGKNMMRRESDEVLIRLDENVKAIMRDNETILKCYSDLEARVREREKEAAVTASNLLTAGIEIGKLRNAQGIWSLLNSIGVFLAGIIGYVR
jgi:hypothetical protein